MNNFWQLDILTCFLLTLSIAPPKNDKNCLAWPPLKMVNMISTPPKNEGTPPLRMFLTPSLIARARKPSHMFNYIIFNHILKASITGKSCKFKGKTYKDGERIPCSPCHSRICVDGYHSCGIEVGCGKIIEIINNCWARIKTVLRAT